MMRPLLPALLLAVAACGTPGPRPVTLGLDTCAQCRMPLADDRFAAQLVTRTGRTLVFDDVACLLAHLEEGATPAADVAGLWVADFRTPGTWLSVEDAEFVAADGLQSPMQGGLAAVPPGPAADSLRVALGGTLLDWTAVRARPPAHAS